MRVASAGLLAFLLPVGVALADIETAGSGKNQELVVSGYPEVQQKRYPTFQQRCSKCHALARPIQALREGKTPVSGSPFEERDIKKYVIKMMRKPNSGVSKEDAKEIILFLQYVRTLAAQP